MEKDEMKTKELRGPALIHRYKSNYKIPHEAEITEEMILRHWELERSLTTELLGSTPDNSWEVFERCYSRLYSELDWLNELVDKDMASAPSEEYRDWVRIIGPSPKSIYEIGSGKGGLVKYLASLGHQCKATEITRERGQKHIEGESCLSWGISDGVHLDKFESSGSYDVLVSNQVVEHLHPDDLGGHFIGALSILKRGGRYLFSTPHRSAGPSDVSRVFKCNTPRGMHLHEYTYSEIRDSLVNTGFRSIKAVWSTPSPITNKIGIYIAPRSSSKYLSYQCFIERLISLLPRQSYKRRACLLSNLILFNPSIFIIAQK